MIEIGTERIKHIGRAWLKGWLRMEQPDSEVPDLSVSVGQGHFWMNQDENGVTHLYFKNDDNETFDLCHGSSTGGSGGGGTTIINNITNVSGGNDHLHRLTEWTADGVATVFYLRDLAEYVEVVTNAGAVVDPKTYTLHANKDRITFSAAPTAANLLTANYVVQRLTP